MQRTNATLDSSTLLSSYLQNITNFCPYLHPSISAKLCTIRTESIHGETLHECQAELFYLGVQETELFRIARRETALSNKSGLLCYNLLLIPPPIVDTQGKELFGWPHYLLKLLYTDQAILFGKFWKGEKDQSLSGAQLPIPPIHLLSIRSRISKTDRRFFEKSPELLEAHIDGEDTGDNVHEQFGLKADDCKNIERLRNINYYNTLLAYGKQILTTSTTN
jgi:hypothetical protein